MKVKVWGIPAFLAAEEAERRAEAGRGEDQEAEEAQRRAGGHREAARGEGQAAAAGKQQGDVTSPHPHPPKVTSR